MRLVQAEKLRHTSLSRSSLSLLKSSLIHIISFSSEQSNSSKFCNLLLIWLGFISDSTTRLQITFRRCSWREETFERIFETCVKTFSTERSTGDPTYESESHLTSIFSTYSAAERLKANKAATTSQTTRGLSWYSYCFKDHNTLTSQETNSFTGTPGMVKFEDSFVEICTSSAPIQ